MCHNPFRYFFFRSNSMSICIVVSINIFRYIVAQNYLVRVLGIISAQTYCKLSARISQKCYFFAIFYSLLFESNETDINNVFSVHLRIHQFSVLFVIIDVAKIGSWRWNFNLLLPINMIFTLASFFES